MIKTLIVIIFSIATVLPQDNLLTLLDEKDLDESYPVQGTFKATRIVNAQSIELRYGRRSSTDHPTNTPTPTHRSTPS